MEREQWLAARRQGIGGTDIAAIAGLHPYSSPSAVWSEKLGLTEVAENEPMRWGKRLENAIAEEYAERESVEIFEGGWVQQTVRGVLLCGSPDRLIKHADKGLEIKTGSHWSKGWGDGPADVPSHYYIQCQWYMMLTGRREWDLAVLLDGRDYRVYRLQSHPRLQAALTDKAVDFWERYVATKTPPPPDATDDYAAAVGALLPRKTPPAEPTEEHIKVASELWEAKKLLKETESRVKLLQNQLLEGMNKAQATGLACEQWRAQSIEVKGRATTDWKQLVKDLNIGDDTLARYTRIGQNYRQFRFTWKGEDE